MEESNSARAADGINLAQLDGVPNLKHGAAERLRNVPGCDVHQRAHDCIFVCKRKGSRDLSTVPGARAQLAMRIDALISRLMNGEKRVLGSASPRARRNGAETMKTRFVISPIHARGGVPPCLWRARMKAKDLSLVLDIRAPTPPNRRLRYRLLEAHQPQQALAEAEDNPRSPGVGPV